MSKSDVKLFRRGGETHIRFVVGPRSDIVCAGTLHTIVVLEELRAEGLNIPQAMIDRRRKKHAEMLETLGRASPGAKGDRRDE